MTARGVGRKERVGQSNRGGRREVSREALAGRPRSSHVGRGRYASRRQDDDEAAPAVPPPGIFPSVTPVNGAVQLPPPPAEDAPPPPPQQPRPPTAEMLELMADWPDEWKAAAQRAVDAIETNFVIPKGTHAGQPFLLEPWQERIVRLVFGPLQEDPQVPGRLVRTVRTLYLEVPRKNAKSTLMATLAFLLAFLDGEKGAEVYCAATNKKQAMIVFRAIKAMIRKSDRLRGMVNQFVELIEAKGDESTFIKPISSDADTQQGLDPHGSIVDELHAHKNGELLDALESASGARSQPLELIITTAGEAKDGIGWEKHEYARRVISGEIVDPTWVAVIYAADEKDDWTSPETWKKANPNLGVSVRLDYLHAQCQKALKSPRYVASFKRYHLNIWNQSAERFIPGGVWDACALPVDIAKLKGIRPGSGLDLSTTLDLTANVHVWAVLPEGAPPPPDPAPDTPPPEAPAGADRAVGAMDCEYHVLARFFMPADRLKEAQETDNVPYQQWVDDGFIELTDGAVIDYPAVRQSILDDHEHLQIRDLAFDPFGATHITQELENLVGEKSSLPKEKRLNLVPFRQGFLSMSGPTKDLLTLLTAKKIRHGGNPVLSWMADACTAIQDAAGNVKLVKPDRRKNARRIDGIIALIMALDRAMRNQAEVIAGDKSVSTYEDEGILVL